MNRGEDREREREGEWVCFRQEENHLIVKDGAWILGPWGLSGNDFVFDSKLLWKSPRPLPLSPSPSLLLSLPLALVFIFSFSSVIFLFGGETSDYWEKSGGATDRKGRKKETWKTNKQSFSAASETTSLLPERGSSKDEMLEFMVIKWKTNVCSAPS